MKGFVGAVAVCALVVSACGVGGTSTGESCAGPGVALSAPEVARGDRLTVSVDFVSACQDTDPGSVEVFGPHPRQVRIHLVSLSGEQTLLATAAPDQAGRLSTQVTIPATATLGVERISVDYARDATVTIR